MSKRSRDVSEDVSSDSGPETQQATSAKYVHIEPPPTHSNKPESLIRCSLPPHARPYSFPTYEDFDTHIRKLHTNRCSTCNKNFPSNHYLHLHISEVHDSLAEAKRARGDRTFGCFVEGCEKLCYTPQKRRLHLIDKHEFPRNYNFFVTKDGIDKRHSLLVPGRAVRSRSTKDGSEVSPLGVSGDGSVEGAEADAVKGEEQSPEAVSSTTSEETAPALTPSTSASDADMDSLTKTMSSLRFVPPSVRFGRGRGRGFAKR